MEPPIQPGFTPGHPRYGGRRRKPATAAREIAARLGVDPIEYLVRMLAEGTYESVEVGPRGGETRVKHSVPLEMKVDIAKTLAQYIHPKLSAVAVTGEAGGPIETTSISANILMDPDLAEAIQKIAFAQAAVESAEADQRRRLPAPEPSFRE